MDDKRDILKALISKADLRAHVLEAEKKSIQDDLDECYLALEGYHEQLNRLDAAVYIPVPTNGQTIITLPGGNKVVGT